MRSADTQPPQADFVTHQHPGGSALEVGAAFLKLGLSSFGGPIAHLGYFHREFVLRRRWLDEEQFSQLLALCQFCRARRAASSALRWACCEPAGAGRSQPIVGWWVSASLVATGVG